MKDLKIFAAYSLFAFCLVAVSMWGITQDYKYGGNPHRDISEVADTIVVYRDTSIVFKSDWDAFIEALIWVESKGDERAVGKKDDIGILQITPILLQDCNRIIGYEKYYLNDRYDREKSIEMFNLIQDHYNPQKDFHWALKLWNSGAPLSYHRKVMDKFNEIKESSL